MKPLSDKQKQLLDFIDLFIQDHGRPPTVRDIVRGCGLSSTSVADYHLGVLQREGYLRRDQHVSRGIELEGREKQHRGLAVPLLGFIAAGAPIPVPAADTWESPALETVQVPDTLVGGKDKVYALKVKGESMIDALIGDGDIVLVQAGADVSPGDTVAVWLKKEKEVTLKKIYPEGGRVRLQPANSQMKPIYVSPDNIEVQGKVVGVVRKLA